VKKIRQNAALFWFALQDVGIRYSRAVIQRTVLEHGLVEKLRFEHLQTEIQTSRRLDTLLNKMYHNFELLSNIQD